MAAPSFQLPKPQALASSLPSLSHTPDIQPIRISCWLCLQNTSEDQIFLTTSTAAILARPPSSLPWITATACQPSPCLHFPSPGQGDPFIMGQMMSLFCPKPSSTSHFILNKGPWFFKGCMRSTPCSLASTPALPVPSPLLQPLCAPCGSSSVPGTLPPQDLCTLLQPLLGMFCRHLPG